MQPTIISKNLDGLTTTDTAIDIGGIDAMNVHPRVTRVNYEGLNFAKNKRAVSTAETK